MDEWLGKFLLFFMLPFIGALIGSLTGWCTALLYDETIHQVVSVIFQTERFASIELWEFGATAGFLSGWIRPTNYTAKND